MRQGAGAFMELEHRFGRRRDIRLHDEPSIDAATETVELCRIL
jgi:hypothetical protein